MITQNKGEWPACLALTSVTEQFSNYSSNQVYFSPVRILFLELNLDNNWRRVSVKISSVFFFMPEQKVHVKVAESLNKAQLQEWKTAFDSRDKHVKKKDCTKS